VRSVFISYSHDSDQHKSRIQALVDRLRSDDITVVIDLDMLPGGPPEGWPLWSEIQIKNADAVLIACTETYTRRYNGEELPDTGLGSVSEARVIRQTLYKSAGHNEKFRVILFVAEDNNHIANQLEAYHRFLLYQPDDYASLLAWLHGSISTKVNLNPNSPNINWPVPDTNYAWPLANRKPEFSVFQEMITGQTHLRIFLMCGQSNAGKTVCLAQLLTYALHLKVPATLLDLKGCPPLDDVFEMLRLDLGQNILRTAYTASGKARFFNLITDFQQLKEPLALFFDTYEQVSPDTQRWLEVDFLPRLDTAPGVIVVIGGQRVPDAAKYRWIGLAKLGNLQPINSVADWRELITKKWHDSVVQDEHIEGILAATKGDPGKTYATLESMAQQRRQL